MGGSAVLNSIMGTLYSRRRDATIAAARRNNASLWFAGAPADLAGFVWQDSAGTTPATGTDPVGRLVDRAGSNAATQATAANKPTLELQANGFFGMRFDGTNDSLLMPGLTLSNAANHTLITSARVTDISATRTIATGGASTGAAPRVAQIRVNATTGIIQVAYVTDAIVIGLVTGTGSNLNTPIVASVRQTSGTATGFLNGAVFASIAPNAGATTVSGGAIGSQTTGAAEPMAGVTFLVCSCASAMPDADRIAIERFAALLSGATYA